MLLCLFLEMPCNQLIKAVKVIFIYTYIVLEFLLIKKWYLDIFLHISFLVLCVSFELSFRDFNLAPCLISYSTIGSQCFCILYTSQVDASK